MGLSGIFRKAGSLISGAGAKGGAGGPDFDKIRRAIRTKYARVSHSAKGMFQYPVGRAGAEALGYDHLILQMVPDELLESFCGVGNPFSLGEIAESETVLDVGCGAGFDLYVASRLTKSGGKVYGIDFTPEMIARAENNLRQAEVANLEIRLANLEELPFKDELFDRVISNGVLNLSPDKDKAFAEIYRVLKPDGRLQFADVVLREDLPPGLSGSAESWSQ